MQLTITKVSLVVTMLFLTFSDATPQNAYTGQGSILDISPRFRFTINDELFEITGHQATYQWNWFPMNGTDIHSAEIISAPDTFAFFFYAEGPQFLSPRVNWLEKSLDNLISSFSPSPRLSISPPVLFQNASELIWFNFVLESDEIFILLLDRGDGLKLLDLIEFEPDTTVISYRPPLDVARIAIVDMPNPDSRCSLEVEGEIVNLTSEQPLAQGLSGKILNMTFYK